MADTWDKDYNITNLTELQIAALEQAEIDSRNLEYNRRLGYFEIPLITHSELITHFNTHRRHNEDIIFSNDRRALHSIWNANRIIWICHDCGCLGYKYGLRELFKCYNYSCRSRNVTVCRSGEISLALRNITRGEAGVNMINVFNTRRERMKTERRNR
jgi:hypothetical protein